MKRALIAAMLLSLIASVAFAETEVTFTWSPRPESDLAGYRLYQGTASGVYAPEHIEEVPVGTETVTIEVADGTYFWALTAFDQTGNEGLFSEEITRTYDTTPPGAPTDFEVVKEIVITRTRTETETIRIRTK